MSRTAFDTWRRFRTDDCGVVTIEYAVIAAFLSLAIAAAVSEIGTGVEDMLQGIKDGF